MPSLNIATLLRRGESEREEGFPEGRIEAAADGRGGSG